MDRYQGAVEPTYSDEEFYEIDRLNTRQELAALKKRLDAIEARLAKGVECQSQ